MKLAQILTEMTLNNLNVSFKDDSIDVTYKRKRVTIFTVSKTKKDEYLFTASAEWDSPSMTVKATSPKAAYNKVKKNVEKNVFRAFGGATPGAKRVGKKLEI